MKKTYDLEAIENLLHHLNYRWNLEVLAIWQGKTIPIREYRMYEGYDDFLSPDTLAVIETAADPEVKKRLKFNLIGHYLQSRLMPHDVEMQTWIRGAAARVHGEKVFWREIIPWCQKFSNYEKRQILQKETSALCKFLKPFAFNYWTTLLESIQELGFADYLDYSRRKKGIHYSHFYQYVKFLMAKTDQYYFPAMEAWSLRRFKRPLGDLTRFDSMNLLSLGEFDPLLPDWSPEALLSFFSNWGMDIATMPGLHLEIGAEKEKNAQAISIFLDIPEDIYVFMRPQGGWIDPESLWHELGHGLSAALTSPGLSLVEREMATDFALSESYAFLLQAIVLSPVFLQEFFGLSPEDARRLHFHKLLRDLSAFRRYGAKFIAEYEMFTRGDLDDGEPYARIMEKYTGFYHQPESHLFDLIPEFYSLDYLLGWMGAAMLEAHLQKRFGERWIFAPETGKVLKSWWQEGNRHDIFGFMEKFGLGEPRADLLLRQWEQALNA